MTLEQRILTIKEKLEGLSGQYDRLKESQEQTHEENIRLKEELKALKTTNFELTKQIEIAEMADQLNNDNESNDVLKAKLDKYIREIDAVVKALKKM